MSGDAPVLLDLSRLIWRAWNPIPTGIDRVELAYAEYFLADPDRSKRTIFVALNLAGRVGAIPPADARLFLERLSALWGGGAHVASPPQRRSVDRKLFRSVRLQSLGIRWRVLAGGEARLARLLRDRAGTPIYLLVSHHHLNRSEVIARVKERFGARFVCLVHDLIPIDFPEYARPDHDRRHANRMEVVQRHAEGVIVNSDDTAESLRRFLAKLPEDQQRPIEIRTALLGTPSFPALPAVQDVSERPYFIFLATLEPRKNHLMLLNVWRSLSGLSNPPRLVLVGRRGWEIENVIDMLDRCPGLQGLVEEYNDLSDMRLASLLSGARALLLPSFAEGYGLPVAEALVLGVPVLCSNLPSFREIGGGAPEYFDALDALSWRQAIIDYTVQDSPRRAAQIERIATWQAPNWTQHFTEVENLLADIG